MSCVCVCYKEGILVMNVTLCKYDLRKGDLFGLCWARVRRVSMRSMGVSSCICCMFVSYVHPVAVLNAAFGMTCNLLMLVEDARGDHMEEAYSRTGLMTALYVAMSVSFCLPHPFAGSAFIICSDLCACTELL